MYLGYACLHSECVCFCKKKKKKIDLTTFIENEAICNILSQNMKIKKQNIDYSNINRWIAKMTSSLTASFRYKSRNKEQLNLV